MSMKVKFYTSNFAQAEGRSIFDVLAVLDFVYNARHDTNDKCHKSFTHVVELFTYVDLFQTERHKVY